eukprot:6200577-Pleurochrysis_carterae.AAC.6
MFWRRLLDYLMKGWCLQSMQSKSRYTLFGAGGLHSTPYPMSGASFAGAILDGARFQCTSRFLRCSQFEELGCPPEFNRSEIPNLDESQGVSFKGASLREAILHRTIFSKADLRGADLSGSTMEFTEMQESNFDFSTKWQDALLDDCDFARSQMDNVKMDAMTLQRTTFEASNLMGASFRSSVAASSDFSNTKAAGIDFTGTDLKEAEFIGAVLTGATFRGANLLGAMFSGAQLGAANFAGAKNVQKAEFTGAIGVPIGLDPAALG